MRRFLVAILFLSATWGFAQSPNYTQQNFCKSLHKVFELGRKDNFDSYDATMVKQSAFLAVPGYSIKLDEFPITYVDKDNRFVAKTNLNLDSLSAFKKIEDLKLLTGFCLDTIQWTKWEEVNGDDATTVFFKEFKEERAISADLTLNLAIIIVAPKVYSLVMYAKRNR